MEHTTWEQISTVKRKLNWKEPNFERKQPNTTLEMHYGTINSFYTLMSLPAGLYLLERSRRTHAYTHC